jgi:hypothetical protein
MTVEIGALVHKDCGPAVIDELNGIAGVITIFIETGRSNDLFEDRQFGKFGEAAIITVIADRDKKQAVFDRLFDACKLQSKTQGIIFMADDMIRSSLDKP